MRKAYKTELKPNALQAAKIRRTIGICRFIYNKYIQMNIERSEPHSRPPDIGERAAVPAWFISAADFDRLYLPHLADIHAFISGCPDVFVQEALFNAETAFQRYFQGKADLPRFKARNVGSITLVYPKRLTASWQIAKDAVIIPGLDRLKLKERGYLPSNTPIIKGSISCIADRYFISAVVNHDAGHISSDAYNEGIGIYINKHNFIALDDGTQIKGIEKRRSIVLLKKKIAREMRSLSRRSHDIDGSNRSRLQEKIMKLRLRLKRIRTDYINKIIAEIIHLKPAYIVLGDIEIRKEAAKSDELKAKLRDHKLIEFKSRLLIKCHAHGIELRMPQSIEAERSAAATCSRCHSRAIRDEADSDMLVCTHCGLCINKNQNAAINLKHLQEYLIL